MKPLPNVIALALIILGIIFLSYAGFSYTTQEQVAQIGTLKITNEEKKTVPFSPVAGGICIILGVGIIIFNRMKR